MIYTMLKKSFGISNINSIFSFEFNYDIIDLCYVNNFGFFFLTRGKYCIGLITPSGKVIFPWIGEADKNGNLDGDHAIFINPSSLCYFDNALFLIDDNGRQIRKISLSAKYVSSMIYEKETKKLNNLFKKLSNNTVTSCDINNFGDIIWAVKDLNRVLKFRGDTHEVETFIGDGRSGFSVANKPNECSIKLPTGVKYVNNFVLLCDSGNHCIRSIGNNIVNIFIGNPAVSGDSDGTKNDCLLNYPYGLKYVNNTLCFLDNQKIKQLSPTDKEVKTIRSFNNKVLIETDKKDLFILERSL